MILTNNTLEDYKQFTEQRISDKAEYQIGGVWYETQIQRKERMTDGRIAVYVPVVPHSSGPVTLQGVRLYNEHSGEIWAQKTGINITVTGVNRSILYRFTFDIKENEVT